MLSLFKVKKEIEEPHKEFIKTLPKVQEINKPVILKEKDIFEFPSKTRNKKSTSNNNK